MIIPRYNFFVKPAMIASDMDLKIDSRNTIDSLRQEMEAKYKKLPLCQEARDVIHGEGPVPSRVMLIGEAPGYYEYVQRRPFVGRSGQLLRKTLTSVGFPPESVYISNIVKARPPENRDPTPEEIMAYKPYLDCEIALVAPQLIVTLGRYSMAKFLPEVKISQVHGRLHQVKWQDKLTYILPMYHPAAALRAGEVLKSFQADFAKMAKILTYVENQLQTHDFADTVLTALV